MTGPGLPITLMDREREVLPLVDSVADLVSGSTSGRVGLLPHSREDASVHSRGAILRDADYVFPTLVPWQRAYLDLLGVRPVELPRPVYFVDEAFYTRTPSSARFARGDSKPSIPLRCQSSMRLPCLPMRQSSSASPVRRS